MHITIILRPLRGIAEFNLARQVFSKRIYTFSNRSYTRRAGALIASDKFGEVNESCRWLIFVCVMQAFSRSCVNENHIFWKAKLVRKESYFRGTCACDAWPQFVQERKAFYLSFHWRYCQIISHQSKACDNYWWAFLAKSHFICLAFLRCYTSSF